MSDYMKHDSNVMYAFLGKVLNLLKGSWSILQKCISFSDSAGYQNFANHYHHMSDFQLAAKWNFLLYCMEKALVTA